MQENIPYKLAKVYDVCLSFGEADALMGIMSCRNLDKAEMVGRTL